MQEQTALDLFRLQEKHTHWQRNVTGYCSRNDMQIGNLPDDLGGPYEELNAAWEKLKSGGETASDAAREQFHRASQMLEKAWQHHGGR